tara:strand:- start:12914 stop:13213 length:300 start_codon:yes stop_codon:yes gene_type:complete
MCKPGPFVADYLFHTNDRLQSAIDRLERLKDEPWCDDALLVLAAARKHLETLPQPVRYVVTMSSPTPPLVREFDTHAEAIAYLTVNLTRYENFQIRVAE